MAGNLQPERYASLSSSSSGLSMGEGWRDTGYSSPDIRYLTFATGGEVVFPTGTYIGNNV